MSESFQLKDKPRTGAFAEKEGAYHLASRVFTNTINPGAVFKFEQYITGYGEISTAKIQCYISSEIFDNENSTVINSLKEEGNEFSFGAQEDKISGEGFTCHLSGAVMDGWSESTMFVDMSGDKSKTLLTEHKLENAPFFYKLKLKDDVKPGGYTIDFYFTYYNGDKWQCSKESVDLTVRNFFEIHAKTISTLAIVAASISIIRFGVIPLIECLKSAMWD
jgi:hypothetical protein